MLVKQKAWSKLYRSIWCDINLSFPVCLVVSPTISFWPKSEAQLLWEFARFRHLRKITCWPTEPVQIQVYSIIANIIYWYTFMHILYTGRDVKNRTFWHVRPTKTQISLRIRAVWSDSLLSALRNFVSLAIQNAPNEDSDQPARMRRLIWIFLGRTCLKGRFLTSRHI